MEKYLPQFRVLILIACLAAGAAFYASGLLNHDPSFLLLATRRWLHGATLYRDIMETNPPLIFYLMAPAVVLSEWSGISASTVFVILVCIAAGISVAWCWSLLSRVTAIPLSARYVIVAACFAALLVTPAYNFGQREHMFIILALPYLIAMGLAPAGLQPSAREKIALGLFAVLGFALKPYFLIPAVLVSLALCLQQRSWRPLLDPANVTIGLGCVAYLIFAAVFHPAYFNTIIPLGADIYGAIADDTANIPVRSILPLVLIASVVSVGHPSPPLRNSLLALSAVLLGLWLVFAIQRKVWDYQILPFESMGLIVAVIALVLTWRSIRSKPLQFAVFVAIPTVLLTGALRDGHYDNPYTDEFAARLEQVAPDWKGKSVLVLTTNVSAAFPFINEVGADWAGRYPYQWLIAGARTRESAARCATATKFCGDMDAILDYARRTNVDDLAAHTPDVVFIDERQQKSYLPDEPFDYVAFLDGDPRFHEIWRRYKKIDTVLSYDIWLRS